MPLAPPRTGEAYVMGKDVVQASKIKVVSPEEGKVEDKYRLYLDGAQIPAVTKKPLEEPGEGL